MSKLEWDKLGEHYFETGVDHGVLYPMINGGRAYGKGVAWNGLTAVNEQPEGAEPNDQYADNIKYLSLRSAETYGATIEAFNYPEEFRSCDGQALLAPGVVIGQQNRTPFGFAYRTLKGNDTQGTDYGYILHLVYGCTVSPSEKNHATVNDSPEAMTFSWTMDTVPVAVLNHKPTATVTLDSTEIPAEQMARIEHVLYGGIDNEPRLPIPDEIVGILETPVEMFKVSMPDPDTEIGNRTVADMIDNVEINPDTGAMTGTVKKVRGWTGPTGSNVSITNYIVPFTFEKEPGAKVQFAVKSKDGGVLATIKSYDGNEYVILTKNHEGAKVVVTQSDTNDFKNDKTIVKEYDLSGLVIDDAEEPVDKVTMSTTSTYIKTYMSDKHPEKTVDDLQSDLVLRAEGGSKFTAEGTLHNVEGFTSFYDKERPNGHFMIFRMAPKDTSHRIGVKSSEAKGGTDSVFDANDFIVLARVDDFLKQKDKSLTVYEYDAAGAEKLNTFTIDLSKLALE